jgi:hypothetical protein
MSGSPMGAKKGSLALIDHQQEQAGRAFQRLFQVDQGAPPGNYFTGTTAGTGQLFGFDRMSMACCVGA